MLSEVENWKPIPGFEESYQASDLGRIRSIDRHIKYGRHKRFSAGRVLSPAVDKNGRRYVSLKKAGLGHSITVSTLVLTTFGSPNPGGLECCHGDGDNSNNRFRNLRWDTHAANMADAKMHGTFAYPDPPRGEANGQAILTTEDVRCIRAEPQFLGVGKMLASAFGISAAQVSAIRSGAAWAHV